jgi:pimeloyl-ACP methyl ester carboxylesterase
MAEHIPGPLYYERMGRTGPVMAFVHPNPLDQSCWLFQMARFSTWFRCIAIDIPGYGRSPKADAGLTLGDIAAGCWEAIDDAFGNERAILVGSSVGSQVLPYMHRLNPARSIAMIMSGVGYNPAKEFAVKLLDAYGKKGVDYRWEHAFLGMSPSFRGTPMAHYLVNLFVERNQNVDIPSLLHQFRAHQMPDPEDLHLSISCPSIVISGTEDGAYATATVLQERIPGCERKVLPGAGHTSHLEQPWLFDEHIIDFLKRHSLFPRSAKRTPATNASQANF